jgi:hypothetical protein
MRSGTDYGSLWRTVCQNVNNCIHLGNQSATLTEKTNASSVSGSDYPDSVLPQEPQEIKK